MSQTTSYRRNLAGLEPLVPSPALALESRYVRNGLADTGDTVWTKQIKGRSNASSGTGGTAVAVDNTGDVYLYGKFARTVYFDDIRMTWTNNTSDLYLTRLDSAGNFIWVKQFAGNGSSNSSSSPEAGALKVDDQNVYAAGHFGRFTPLEPLDFDPGPNTYELTSAGEIDGFVIALDKSGGDFAWARRMGVRNDFDLVHDIDLYQGNIYVTGRFSGMADFGGQTLNSGGGDDGFVSQIDSSGNFVQTWQIGLDRGHGIAVDTSGNV